MDVASLLPILPSPPPPPTPSPHSPSLSLEEMEAELEDAPACGVSEIPVFAVGMETFLHAPGKSPNKGAASLLKEIAGVYLVLGDQTRYRSYALGAIALSDAREKVETKEDALRLSGVGQSLATKIAVFVKTGKCALLDSIYATPKWAALSTLIGIWGVGPTTARKWYHKGISSLDELRASDILLSDRQALGIKFYDDFQIRMPREEVEAHIQIIADVIHQVQSAGGEEDDSLDLLVVPAGSYRRGKASSHDADIIITTASDAVPPHALAGLIDSLIDALYEADYIQATLSVRRKLSKAHLPEVVADLESELFDIFFGIVRLPPPYSLALPGGPDPVRRLDILVVPRECFPVAFLFFTGSAMFNRILRIHAKKLGYKLNNDKIFPIDDNDLPLGPPVVVKTEADVFDLLGLPWIPPQWRNS